MTTGYLVVIQGEDDSYPAYTPDLPGCVAAGDSIEEVSQLMREAIPPPREPSRAEPACAVRPQSSLLLAVHPSAVWFRLMRMTSARRPRFRLSISLRS